MGLNQAMLDFLQVIAIGAGGVLLLLVMIRLGTPRRSGTTSRHRPTD